MDPFRLVDDREFDPVTGELRRGQEVTRLEPQPAAVLALLASRAGHLVTHDEIRRALWGDNTHVKLQDSVHYCVRQIRAALDDRAQAPRFVETIPRRGYRLRADAVAMPGVATSPPLVVPRTSPVTGALNVLALRRLGAACFLAAVLATAAHAERRPNNHHEIAVSVLKTVHDFVF
jgi:DNA-binding winged helix-turn-helix (wHTH) protein